MNELTRLVPENRPETVLYCCLFTTNDSMNQSMTYITMDYGYEYDMIYHLYIIWNTTVTYTKHLTINNGS